MLRSESDPELLSLAKDEQATLEGKKENVEERLRRALVPKDPNDDRNIFLEIRAGTGGDEAALFAGDLFRMYSNFAEKQHWKIEALSRNAGDHGGFKEIISRQFPLTMRLNPFTQGCNLFPDICNIFRLYNMSLQEFVIPLPATKP